MNRTTLLQCLEALDVRIASTQPNSGGYIPCFCPLAEFLHENAMDKNPSFFAKVDEQGMSGWHCFTCKQHGGKMSSLARVLGHYREENYNRIAITADMEEIPTSFDSWERDEETDSIIEPLDPNVYDGLYPEAITVEEADIYLEGRGISQEAAKTMGLLFDPEERRVLFPVKDRKQELYGFSGRSILEPHEFPQGYARHRDYNFPKERFLLGEHLYQKGKPIWIVEGLFAYARMIELGARTDVNPMAPMMSSLSKYQVERLEDMNERVFLCFDPDKAGDYGTAQAVPRLKNNLTVLLPPIPEDMKNEEGELDVDAMTQDQFYWMMDNAEAA